MFYEGILHPELRIQFVLIDELNCCIHVTLYTIPGKGSIITIIGWPMLREFIVSSNLHSLKTFCLKARKVIKNVLQFLQIPFQGRNYGPNDVITETISRYQTLQLQHKNTRIGRGEGDLSGAKIECNKPCAAYSGKVYIHLSVMRSVLFVASLLLLNMYHECTSTRR